MKKNKIFICMLFTYIFSLYSSHNTHKDWKDYLFASKCSLVFSIFIHGAYMFVNGSLSSKNYGDAIFLSTLFSISSGILNGLCVASKHDMSIYKCMVYSTGYALCVSASVSAFAEFGKWIGRLKSKADYLEIKNAELETESEKLQSDNKSLQKNFKIEQSKVKDYAGKFLDKCRESDRLKEEINNLQQEKARLFNELRECRNARGSVAIIQLSAVNEENKFLREL